MKPGEARRVLDLIVKGQEDLIKGGGRFVCREVPGVWLWSAPDRVPDSVVEPCRQPPGCSSPAGRAGCLLLPALGGK